MRLQFIFSEIWIGLRRNLSMTISVILVTFVSLGFVGAAALLQTQITKFKGEWYDKVEVSVFLCPTNSKQTSCATGEVTDQQISDIKTVLASPDLAPEIQSVAFETKAEAWADFQERFSDQWWMSNVTEADMNSSFRIKLVNPENYQVVHDVLTGRAGVEEVRDERELLEPIFLMLNRATMVSAGLAAVMLLAAVLLITTTIRLSALSRRRETGIMRLVGASNIFIQLPFMLEGAIAALIGGGLAVLGLWAGVKFWVAGWLQDTVQWIPVVTVNDVWRIAPILIIVAVLLAAISSLVTLRRYMKV